ncbi:helix-hairpin-helix domain-containing protein [uncultured Bacteroides sp.]|uniref:helix-hairpin-helix domain-containing protein n=1 Tax=uncultured Bacteroides sp. TaxID=162156 RepID=UPI002600B9CB|nr:helix-hairpin-helix domain-containing protein [uncultured Bacteroides sp.]
MKNPLKDFLFFSRGERRGILALIIAIILVFLSGHIYSFLRNSTPLSDEEIRMQALALKEYDNFISSIQEQEKSTRNSLHYAETYKKRTVVLAPFDPNRADSIAFCRLGLPAWMAKNILRYRSKGGKFRKTEDFKKVYGLTEEQYRALAPYIYFTTEDTIRQTAFLLTLPQAKKDSIYKYPAGTMISLNNADTTELKKIPGIGSGIARLIVGYRQRLGGFYQIEQLQDINLDYRPLQAWFTVAPSEIRRINLNHAGIERLRSHPYINFYQAKAFVQYRKKRGTLHNLKPFALYEEFTENDLERLSHYVCFE